MISSLIELYARFDLLYSDIVLTCKGCSDHDCEGYIWLLPEESYNLNEEHVSTVQLNESCLLINPFEKDNIISEDFETMKPPCPLRHNRLCFIYNSRPLVCRMYPIGFTTVDEKVQLVLFKQCKYVNEMTGQQKEQFVNNAIAILSDCSEKLYYEIVKSYSAMDALSKYPDGANEYEVLANVPMI